MLWGILPDWNNDCHAVVVAAVLSQDFNANPLEKSISFWRQDPEQIENVKDYNSFPQLNFPFSLTSSDMIEK